MKKVLILFAFLTLGGSALAMQRAGLAQNFTLHTGKVISVNGPVLSTAKTDESNVIVLTPSTLYWFNAQTGRPNYSEPVANGSQVAVVHTQDFRRGRWAIGYKDGRIQILDSIKGNMMPMRSWLTGHTGAITALVGFKDPYLISGSQDGTVKIWDVVTGKELKSFNVNKPVHEISAQVTPQNIVNIAATLVDGSVPILSYDLSGKAQLPASPAAAPLPAQATPSAPVTSTEEEEVLEAR